MCNYQVNEENPEGSIKSEIFNDEEEVEME